MPFRILPYQLKEQIRFIKEKYFFPPISLLVGNVLEIGFGNGENFKSYNKDCFVYAIEKKVDLNDYNKTQEFEKCNIDIQQASVENLKYKDEFFDAIVGSFVLCSVESLDQAFFELTRVLKKGGKLIFIEHIQSSNALIIVFQKLLTSIFGFLSIDCHLDRDPRNYIPLNKYQIIFEKEFDNSLEPYLYLEAVKL